VARQASKKRQVRAGIKTIKAKPRPKVKPRTRKVKRHKPALQNVRQSRFSSLNEVLLHNILKGDDTQKVSEEALLILQAPTSITNNMRDLSFREGFSIGKVLYGICAYYNPKSWYEEYILELARFFEKAGYGGTTYTIFPDKIAFEIYGKELNLGANMHSFEAGVLSGFITSARGSYTHLQEIDCRCNGAKSCSFSTLLQPSDRLQPQPKTTELMQNLAAHINSVAIEKKGPTPSFSDYYYALLLHNLLARQYVQSFKSVFSFLGESMLKQKRQSSKPINAAYIEKVLKLLHLGDPRIESIRPIKAKIIFNRLSSKRDLVELSVDFLGGLLGELSKNTIATESSTAGGYALRLHSEAARRTHK